VRDIQRYSPVGDGVAKTDVNGMLVAYGEYRVLETENDMLKAEVERLTKAIDLTIIDLDERHERQDLRAWEFAELLRKAKGVQS
jgi:hypothetical protein